MVSDTVALPTILQVSTSDSGGGAEQIALSLHRNFRKDGVPAHLAVGTKSSNEPGVFSLAPAGPVAVASRTLRRVADRLRRNRFSHLRGTRIFAESLEFCAHPVEWWQTRSGIECFSYPGSHELISRCPDKPDLVHAHNLHGSYFDLRMLPALSQAIPVVVTLHDAWLTTGHCAHGKGCDRWKTGCGFCPDLSAAPSVPHDRTGRNWIRKKQILERCNLHVASPCRWLLEQVEESILAPAIRSRAIIPNGVDLKVFSPGDKIAARWELGLPVSAKILLFAAYNARSNSYKDFDAMRRTVETLAGEVSNEEILFLAVGETCEDVPVGPKAKIRGIPFQHSAGVMASYYRAADLYLHAAHADTFPTTVLEALASGLPVVATSVGGISEQIEDGVTGFLAPRSDYLRLAQSAARLISDRSLQNAFSKAAVSCARRNFNRDLMSNRYLEFYGTILDRAAVDFR